MSYIEERNKYWTIYPEHVDYRLSRRLGRKIPLDFAIDNPTIEEIISACKSLKIPYRLESDKMHPSNWIEKKGRIKTPKLKKISKRKLLKLIAHRIKQIREKKIAVKKKETPQRKQVQRMLEKIKKR
ncbi:MAG: signal recognition particle subunit SRP19/SEC65 family protein [Candidatus Njordarchaeota archaeon]